MSKQEAAATAPEVPAESAPKEKPAKAQGGGGKQKIILILLAVISAVVLKLGVFLLFIGMLPAIVAYETDRTKSKFVSSTVCAFNLAGVFPDVMQVFIAGGTLEILKIKLLDPYVWLIMYGSAGLGWCMVLLSPIIASTMLESIYVGKLMHMENMQKKAEEEWGEEISPDLKEK